MVHKKAFSIGAASLFVLMYLSIGISVSGGSPDTSFSTTQEYQIAKATDIPIHILTEEEGTADISTPLKFGTSKITQSNDLKDAQKNKAVIIDQSWSASKTAAEVNTAVKELVDGGHVITSVGTYSIFADNPLLPFIAFADDADVFSIYYSSDNDRYVCYSADGKDQENSIEKTYCWINEEINGLNVIENVPNGNSPLSLDFPWGTEYESRIDAYLSGYGWMYVRTIYFALQESNARYNYYYAHYLQQSVPDSNRYTADIYTYTRNYQENLDIINYGPTTTEGQTTVGVSFSLGYSDGVSGEVSASWSYSINDVVVKDRTRLGEGIFDIWHDVNEDMNVGKYSYKAEPGKLMKVDCESGGKSGYCIQRDIYSIQFCKKGLFGSKTFSTLEKQAIVFFKGLPHTLTIDSNGADGSIWDLLEPGSFIPVEVETHSEGTYVKLYDREYYRNGYIFKGFSTNPSATTAEYNIGDEVRIMNDVTLYAVWVPR